MTNGRLRRALFYVLLIVGIGWINDPLVLLGAQSPKIRKSIVRELIVGEAAKGRLRERGRLKSNAGRALAKSKMFLAVSDGRPTKSAGDLSLPPTLVMTHIYRSKTPVQRGSALAQAWTVVKDLGAPVEARDGCPEWAASTGNSHSRYLVQRASMRAGCEDVQEVYYYNSIYEGSVYDDSVGISGGAEIVTAESTEFAFVDSEIAGTLEWNESTQDLDDASGDPLHMDVVGYDMSPEVENGNTWNGKECSDLNGISWVALEHVFGSTLGNFRAWLAGAVAVAGPCKFATVNTVSLIACVAIYGTLLGLVGLAGDLAWELADAAWVCTLHIREPAETESWYRRPYVPSGSPWTF